MSKKQKINLPFRAYISITEIDSELNQPKKWLGQWFVSQATQTYL